MTELTTVSHMCKSARAMGLSKAKWLKIEDHVSTILDSSGPEYLIGYLKELREAKLDEMVGNEVKLSWHKVNRQGKPADWQALLWNFRKPKTSIQILGAMVNSIELTQLTSKQLDKWESAVRHSPKANPSPDLNLETMRFNKDLELALEIAHQSVFSPSDVTGTSIPLFNHAQNVLEPKHRRNSKPEKSLAKLLQAYLGTIHSAPAFAGQMEIDSINWVKENFDLEIKDEEERLALAQEIKEQGENLEIQDFSDSALRWKTPRLGLNQRAGHIAFLQQPGGKLRAIANPNRYVQHLFRPLQKVLSKVNDKPGVAVTDQDEGLRWAQQKLNEGKTLHSFDLTSATDTLDSQFFTRNIMKTKQGSLSEDQLEYFDLASKAYWYSPDLGTDVNWNVGQPLGLAPSFSLLTTMNHYCGKLAAKRAGVKPEENFRVVGDDFICTDEVAQFYPQFIEGLGGNANPEKALVSNDYGEFCSQIITKKSSWPIKPKIRGLQEAYFVDLEKSGLNLRGSSYPKKFKTIAEYLSAWSSSDIDNLPSISGPDIRPYNQRYGASAYQSLVSLVTDRLPEPREISVGPSVAYSIEEVGAEDSLTLNILNEGVGAGETLLSSATVRLHVEETRRKYDWKKDKYIPVVSSITTAKQAYKRLMLIEQSSDFDDPALAFVSGIQDPHQEELVYDLLVDHTTGSSLAVARNRVSQQSVDIVLEDFQLHNVKHYGTAGIDQVNEKKRLAQQTLAEQRHRDKISAESSIKEVKSAKDINTSSLKKSIPKRSQPDISQDELDDPGLEP